LKILVVGGGGREHAIAWKLLQSRRVAQVYCAPGNGGTALMDRCQNLPLTVEDFPGIAAAAQAQAVDLVVIGPELPLALGLTDYLQQRNLLVFGPPRAGAQIEASKAWAKNLMQVAQIPTAAAAVFTDAPAALAYVRHQGAPIVIKADGLASGKGVTVALTLPEAEAAIEAAFQGQFGEAGYRLVIEECLTGQEASVLALTDGLTVRPLLAAQDHKRIGVGDTGPNTGGMGAYAPAPLVTPALMERVQQQVLEPAIATLQDWGIDYRGVLYAGLMITPEGDPKVIEFNCRFGDPEIQAILPLLADPLQDLLLACAQQRLETLPAIAWKQEVAACVVLASAGYPGAYEVDQVITGLEPAEVAGAIAFHAGTRWQPDQGLLTDGGRVLGVTALGDSFDEAFDQAYAAAKLVQFSGKYYRPDIGHQVRTPGRMRA